VFQFSSAISYGQVGAIGVVVSAVGVILLFFFGMPFRTKTGGVTHIISASIDEGEKRIERRFTALGWIGFALVLIGSGMQAYAGWRS
jgi:hypothetical protein